MRSKRGRSLRKFWEFGNSKKEISSGLRFEGWRGLSVKQTEAGKASPASQILWVWSGAWLTCSSSREFHFSKWHQFSCQRQKPVWHLWLLPLPHLAMASQSPNPMDSTPKCLWDPLPLSTPSATTMLSPGLDVARGLVTGSLSRDLLCLSLSTTLP